MLVKIGMILLDHVKVSSTDGVNIGVGAYAKGFVVALLGVELLGGQTILYEKASSKHLT